MKRRDFVYKSLAGMGALGTLMLSAPLRAAELTSAKKLIVCFHSGSVEALAADGSWRISTMADPRRSQKPQFIRLNFQVATDSEFDNIVYDELHLAKRSDSYIVRVSYTPPSGSNELFYRFVAADVRRQASRNQYAPQLHASPAKRLVKMS